MADVDNWTEAQCVARSNELRREIREGLARNDATSLQYALDACAEIIIVRGRLLDLSRGQREEIENCLRVAVRVVQNASAK